MLNKITNNNGFTLIEILASIILLTVIISLFLSIFPQMANTNNRNGEYLNAANVGKELLVLVKKNSYNDYNGRLILASSSQLKIENEKFTINSIKEIEKVINTKSAKNIQIKGIFKSINKGFNIEILISKSGVFTNEGLEDIFQQHQVTLIVRDNNSTQLTTTYGYIDEK